MCLIRFTAVRRRRDQRYSMVTSSQMVLGLRLNNVCFDTSLIFPVLFCLLPVSFA